MTSAVSHGGISSYPNIHVPYQWTYADATARLAATGFVPADVGKLARQLDANTLYMLTDDSPETWVLVGGPGASYTDEQAQDAIGAMVADTSSINLTYTDATPELKAEAIFGTTTGTVAEGDHTHAGGTYTDEQARDAIGSALVAGNNIDITVNDGADTITIDVETLTSADITDFTEAAQDAVGGALVDGTGINFTYTDGSNQITAEPIFAGTGSAGTVAHSDHTHGGGTTITVQEGDVDVDTGVSTIDFDGSDFNVTSSPAGEANIALAYGTSAGTPAEGNHDHSGVYQPLDADLTTIAGLVDPNADRILFWDDSAGAYAYLSSGSGLSISGTTLSADVGSPSIGQVMMPRWVTGRYYDTSSVLPASLSSGSITGNILRASLLYVPNTNTVDRIGIPVNTGTVGRNGRFGIYSMGADGNPGALLLDAGTVAMATNSTMAEISIGQALTGGTWYWLASVTDGTVTSVFRVIPSGSALGYATLLSVSNESLGVERAFSYAALPDPFGTPTITTGQMPRIGVRAG